MRRAFGFLTAVCSIAAAVQIISAVLEVYGGGDNTLLQVTAAVFAVSSAVLCFAVGTLLDRVKALEDAVGIYVDGGYGEEASVKKECPVCHSQIDSDFAICPYCENREFNNAYFHDFSEGESFDTDNPDYKGTDFSGENLVSANLYGGDLSFSEDGKPNQ